LHPARIVLALSLASEGKSALSSRGGWVISASTCDEGGIREIVDTVNCINVLCIANALPFNKYFLFITLDGNGTEIKVPRFASVYYRHRTAVSNGSKLTRFRTVYLYGTITFYQTGTGTVRYLTW
jgi:hypothetical protein